MPLPLYGSGLRTARTSAANCPTACLSTPFTTIVLGSGTSTVTPAGGHDHGLLAAPGHVPSFPHATQHLAARSLRAGPPVAQDALVRAQDADAQPIQHGLQLVTAEIPPAARLADPLDVADDPLTL